VKYMTVVCKCGNSFTVPEQFLLRNPSGSIFCRGLTKERRICQLQYATEEILDKARSGILADFNEPELIQKSN
jgi:hypothetical protein